MRSGKVAPSACSDHVSNSPNPNSAVEATWPAQTIRSPGCQGWINKANVSNTFTFLVMISSLIVKAHHDNSTAADYALAYGLFGFAGGVTNWLAVKMLFDKIPFLYGSGVVPRRFHEIRVAVKQMCMQMFFDEDKIKGYLAAHSSELLRGCDISSIIRSALNSPQLDTTLENALTLLSQKPEGTVIKMIAPIMGGVKGLVPKLKPLLLSFADTLGEDFQIPESFDVGKIVPVEHVQREMEAFMDHGLQSLTPEVVKLMIEQVIREHLGWLVVWGNLFGSLIGVCCLAAGLQLGHT